MGAVGTGKIVVSLALTVLLAACGRGAPESERELATRVLATEVAKRVSPKTVLVISNPFSQMSGRSPQASAFEQAGIAGLKSGFGKTTTVLVDFPELKPEARRDPSSVWIDSESKTPLSFLVLDEAFSKLMQRHPKADVIVSLIGLPANLGAYKEWSVPGAPKFALLLPDWRIVGGKVAILQAFHSGKLVAAVVSQPDAQAANTDDPLDFERNFCLVTADNVEALLRDYPGIFGLR